MQARTSVHKVWRASAAGQGDEEQINCGSVAELAFKRGSTRSALGITNLETKMTSILLGEPAPRLAGAPLLPLVLDTAKPGPRMVCVRARFVCDREQSVRRPGPPSEPTVDPGGSF